MRSSVEHAMLQPPQSPLDREARAFSFRTTRQERYAAHPATMAMTIQNSTCEVMKKPPHEKTALPTWYVAKAPR